MHGNGCPLRTCSNLCGPPCRPPRARSCRPASRKSETDVAPQWDRGGRGLKPQVQAAQGLPEAPVAVMIANPAWSSGFVPPEGSWNRKHRD